MKKEQTIKFWEAVRSSTSLKQTLALYEAKKGYGSKRTLERYAQTFNSFQAGDPLAEVIRKTGWGLERVQQLHKWWDEFFGKKVEKALITMRQLEAHRQTLLDAVLPQLYKFEVYPVTDEAQQGLIEWWMHGFYDQFVSLAWGKIAKDNNGKIIICLPLEETTEWRYLLQHLQGDPLAKLVEDWKRAMEYELKTRLDLFQFLLGQSKSEIRLPFKSRAEDCQDSYHFTRQLVFQLYKQILYRILNLRIEPFTTQRFDYFPGSCNNKEAYRLTYRFTPEELLLSPDQNTRNAVADYLITAQNQKPPQDDVLKEAYFEVQKKTRELKCQADYIRLSVAFPDGSSCDACRRWVEKERKSNFNGRDNPLDS